MPKQKEIELWTYDWLKAKATNPRKRSQQPSIARNTRVFAEVSCSGKLNEEINKDEEESAKTQGSEEPFVKVGVILYSTTIAEFLSRDCLTIGVGRWHTQTSKSRLNQILEPLGWRIEAVSNWKKPKARYAYEWVLYHSPTRLCIFYEDGICLTSKGLEVLYSKHKPEVISNPNSNPTVI